MEEGEEELDEKSEANEDTPSSPSSKSSKKEPISKCDIVIAHWTKGSKGESWDWRQCPRRGFEISRRCTLKELRDKADSMHAKHHPTCTRYSGENDISVAGKGRKLDALDEYAIKQFHKRSSGKSGSVVLSLIVRCGFGRYDAEEDREAIAEGVEGAQKKHRQKKKQKKKRKGDDDEDEEECSRILGKLDHKFHGIYSNTDLDVWAKMIYSGDYDDFNTPPEGIVSIAETRKNKENFINPVSDNERSPRKRRPSRSRSPLSRVESPAQPAPAVEHVQVEFDRDGKPFAMTTLPRTATARQALEKVVSASQHFSIHQHGKPHPLLSDTQIGTLPLVEGALKFDIVETKAALSVLVNGVKMNYDFGASELETISVSGLKAAIETRCQQQFIAITNGGYPISLERDGSTLVKSFAKRSFAFLSSASPAPIPTSGPVITAAPAHTASPAPIVPAVRTSSATSHQLAATSHQLAAPPLSSTHALPSAGAASRRKIKKPALTSTPGPPPLHSLLSLLPSSSPPPSSLTGPAENSLMYTFDPSQFVSYYPVDYTSPLGVLASVASTNTHPKTTN